MAGLCKCPPPPLTISTVQSSIPLPKQPTVPASLPILKKRVFGLPVGLSILRPPPVALVIPQRRPIRPDLMKPMPQAAGCVPPSCFTLAFFSPSCPSLFCVFNSGANQSPTICPAPFLSFLSFSQSSKLYQRHEALS